MSTDPNAVAEAPATADVDPANTSGFGVTQNPDNSAEVFDVARIAQENAELRAKLIAENDALKTALADARAAGVSAEGLSDDDVRRIEHPEEFIEEYAARGEHEALISQVGSLSQRLDQVNRYIAGQAQPAATSAPGTAEVTSDPLADSAATVQTPPGDGTQAEALTTDTPRVAADVAGTEPFDPFAGMSDQQLADELARREDREAATSPPEGA